MPVNIICVLYLIVVFMEIFDNHCYNTLQLFNLLDCSIIIFINKHDPIWDKTCRRINVFSIHDCLILQLVI